MTPELFRKAMSELDKDTPRDLACWLDDNVANEYNKKEFVNSDKMAVKDGADPRTRMRDLLGSALDWFSYGN